jgi:hypothetical protein
MKNWHENLSELSRSVLSPDQVSILRSDEKLLSFAKSKPYNLTLWFWVGIITTFVGGIGFGILLFVLYFYMWNIKIKKNYIMITSDRVIATLLYSETGKPSTNAGTTQINIPLKKIDSISYTDKGLNAHMIFVNSSPAQYFSRIEKEDYNSLQSVYNEYLKNIEEIESENKNINSMDSKQNSGVNDLEKLADLLKKGIITDEEFTKKKKEILGL